jgi:hypothetical protein
MLGLLSAELGCVAIAFAAQQLSKAFFCARGRQCANEIKRHQGI